MVSGLVILCIILAFPTPNPIPSSHAKHPNTFLKPQHPSPSPLPPVPQTQSATHTTHQPSSHPQKTYHTPHMVPDDHTVSVLHFHLLVLLPFHALLLPQSSHEYSDICCRLVDREFCCSYGRRSRNSISTCRGDGVGHIWGWCGWWGRRRRMRWCWW